MPETKDSPEPEPAPPAEPEPSEKDEPAAPCNDETVSIEPHPERIGEQADNLRRRSGWFRKRSGGN